jgi:hypothetical protein
MTTHQFDVDEAVKYGIECAILLQNIRFWLAKNKANKQHAYDGYYWTYNSAAAFYELFPYLSRQSITRYLKKLCTVEVLKSANYNNLKYDQTLWYTIPAEFAINDNPLIHNITQNEPSTAQNEQAMSKPLIYTIAQNELSTAQNELSTAQNELSTAQNELPIPDINTDINTDIITTDAKAKKSEKTKKIENDFDVENGFNDLPKELHHAYHYATHNDYWSQTIYDAASFLLVWNNPKRKLRGQYERLIQQSQERKKRHEAKEAKQQAQKNPQATANLNAGSFESTNRSQSGDNHYGTRPQPRQESLFNRVRTREDYLNDPTPF